MVEISNQIIMLTVLVLVVLILFGIVIWMIRSMKRSEHKQIPIQQKPIPPVSVVTKTEKDLPSLDEPISDIEDLNLKDYTNKKGFNIVKDDRSKFSLSRWKDWWQDRRNPHKIVLINMELMNGFHLSFQVTEKDDGFKYRDKMFLFDNESKYYNLDAKLWCYDFHEMFSIPVKRIIPVADIQSSIQTSGITEVEYATNPATIQRFAVSKIAEGIMRGASMDDFFKFIRLMSIIAVIGIYLHLILFILKSGMLSQVTSII